MRALALVLVFVFALPASAQRSVDIERFRPALDGDGFIGVQGTHTPGAWLWNAGLWLNYSHQTLTARTSAGDADVIRHRLLADMQLQVGLGSRGAIAVDVPVVVHQTAFGERLADDGGAIPRQAFGDPRLVGRVRVYGDTEQRERAEGPGVALLAAVTLPAGSDDSFAGEDQVTFDLQALADFHLLGLGGGVMLGWRHRFEDRVIGPTVFRDQLLFGLGIKVPIPVTPGLGARIEVRGALDARDPFSGGARTAVEGDLAFSYDHDGVTYVAGVGTGFSSGVGTPSVRALFGISWAPRVADLDGDGITDDDDACPHLPEDFDGFEDEDGCMDPDNDNDFVPDVDDRCPNEEALEGRDEDEDGCTDAGGVTPPEEPRAEAPEAQAPEASQAEAPGAPEPSEATPPRAPEATSPPVPATPQPGAPE